jgi:endonuclease YncB( thermonuclease family)
MQILIIALVSTVAAIQLTTRSQPVLVKSVIDGDTISVSTYGRVRLLGIDAPKGSREAREKLASLLANRWVHLEQEGGSIDVYNHHAAYVLTDDGQCANTVMVREGLARVSVRQPLTRLGELQRAQSDAQAARRGMWGYTPEIPKRKKKP